MLLQIPVLTVGATVALAWACIREVQATRELFYWTSKMRINASMLRNLANPFNARNLQRWRRRVSVAQDSPDPSVTATFWALGPNDVKLVEKIAAGGAGLVWRAE